MPGADKPVVESTLGEMGLEVDVDETVAIASRLGKGGDVWTRATLVRDARAGKIDVPLRLHVARDRAFAKLEAVKELTDTEAVSARLDLDKHATIPERDGHYVDQDGTVALLEAAARTPDVRKEPAKVELPIATFAPRISAAFLKNLDITTVMAEYDTFFSRSGDQQRRGKNIDNAAQKLDGLVISPGEMVSFNTVVGERSEANGFAKSWEIFKGEMVEGVGGGTCQVASTFHAAVFFGGFDVLERLPHSRPSGYITMGLDSTVVYPGVDLKVRNPHSFPVVVHAKTEGGKLHVELLGKMRPVEVSFGRDVVSTIAFKRKNRRGALAERQEGARQTARHQGLPHPSLAPPQVPGRHAQEGRSDRLLPADRRDLSRARRLRRRAPPRASRRRRRGLRARWQPVGHAALGARALVAVDRQRDRLGRQARWTRSSSSTRLARTRRRLRSATPRRASSSSAEAVRRAAAPGPRI